MCVCVCVLIIFLGGWGLEGGEGASPVRVKDPGGRGGFSCSG